MILKRSSRRRYFLTGVELILAISLVLGLYSSLGLAQEKVRLSGVSGGTRSGVRKILTG